ncbi:MFS transporter [Herpetosiphon giganteus]|uniref:MFS transporter n=1 Tax=Herpetosiphon giganteus TaxID=2029754 RepID=UPI001957FA09|nr:MFS transporter [Herpetosiphon giganteus]MBM7844463.1 MFS family permease [Herpetosiphon giganteus]
MRQSPFYGWWIVSTLGFTEMTSWGVIYYAFSVLLAPMQQELGWSQAHFTGGFSLALFISGIVALPIGRWLDQHGARGLMTLGSCLATVLVVAWANVQTLLAWYLIWAGLGVAMAAILYEPAFAVVATWFQRKRQHALTILTVGGGLASVVYVPLITRLLSTMAWREVLLWLAGGLAILTIPLHGLVLRAKPADLGLLPDGEPLPVVATASTPPIQPSMSLSKALRVGAFWWLALAFGLTTMATFTLGVHLISAIKAQGYAPEIQALAVAILGGSQIPSRILIGSIGRRLPQAQLAWMLCLVQSLAFAIFLSVPSVAGLMLFACLFGAGSGALTPTRAALVADVFGSAQYASISGALALLTTTARALAPVLASLLVALLHSYQPLFGLLLLMCLISAAAIYFIRGASNA